MGVKADVPRARSVVIKLILCRVNHGRTLEVFPLFGASFVVERTYSSTFCDDQPSTASSMSRAARRFLT